MTQAKAIELAIHRAVTDAVHALGRDGMRRTSFLMSNHTAPADIKIAA